MKIKNKNSKNISIIILTILFVAIFTFNSYNVNAICWHIIFCGDDSINHDAKGFLDVVDCDNIAGWACDEDIPGVALQVSFTNYKTDGTHPHDDIPQVTANQRRDDISRACGWNPNHAFSFQTPNALKDGQSYYLRADVIDSTSGIHRLLGTKVLGPCGSSSGLTATPPSITTGIGSPSTSTISGGTPPYDIDALPVDTLPHNTLVSVSKSGSNNEIITIRGEKEGSTAVRIKDSASKTIDITITITTTTTSNQPPCDYPGQYNPGFPVPNPPQTTKQKIGRIMMCYPPLASSMDNVVNYANSVYSVGIKRHCCKPGGNEPRDDTIDLSDGTIVDLIESVGDPNARWQWIEVSGGGRVDTDSSKEACESAGYKWTGSKCCGKPERKPEYYNDVQATAGVTGGVIAGTRITGHVGDICSDGLCRTRCPENCPYCDSNCQPAGCKQRDYGKKNSVCLPSCGVLAKATSPDAKCALTISECDSQYGINNYDVIPGSYDCQVCCKKKTSATSGLTSIPSSITTSINSPSPSTISGGTPPYSIDTQSDSQIADATLSGNNKEILTVTGKKQGSTKVTIKDSTTNKIDITITINVGTTSTPSGACGQGPYFSKLEGFDVRKFNDCTVQTPKYKAGRVFSRFETPKLTDAVIAQLREAGLNPTKISKDVIDFGAGIGRIDTLRAVDDATGIGAAWQWVVAGGSGGEGGLGGCWNSKPVWSVSFVEGTKNSVGNYKGQFYGCAIDKRNYNTENDNLLNLLDSNTKKQLIQNQNYCISDQEKNYYCSFKEEWVQTEGKDKSHLSYVPVQSASLQAAECCAQTECWDGIKCVENQRAKPLEQSTNGFRCIDGNWKKLIQKCSPDGSTCAYCPEESQCLLNPLANNEPAQCIESDKYEEDSYCENGEWSSRTKLLALKLLKMKSNDYTLFCDNRENTLNNLQYVSGSNEVVANVLTNLQTNNFCILKTGNNIIAATSTNKDFEEVPNSLNIFGVTSCSNVADDNQYHSCDTTNKVWYNKKFKSFIYSATAINVPSDSVSFLEFIRNPIRNIISIIKRLIVPSDQASLDAIKKFDRLYMTQQSDKSVIGTVEGRNPINAVIEYKGVNTDICSFIEQFKRTKAPDLSTMSCKKEDNKFYVLAQGSQFTNINPDSIWADLTSKLRLR